ncbi:MAG: hypothetical protein QHC79_18855 [Pseudosphingobacterium sp.]|nr:hypothetical protein [Pseudosphingobacterium sp.]
MKKTIICLLVTIGIISTQRAVAQTEELTQMVKEMTDKQTEQLSLTSEQVPQVESINLDFATKAQKIRGSNDSKMNKSKAMKDLDKERTKSLKAVLTEEQFKKFEAVKTENRKQMKARFKDSK